MSRPANVLLVMSDEHHFACTSVTGHRLVRTPNMARLAARGSVFENAYCPSPLCSPSRSAFVSGRRVHQLQWYNNCNVIERDDPGYGRALANHGVHSVLIGKADFHQHSSKLEFSEVFQPDDRKSPGDLTIGRDPLMVRQSAARRADCFGPQEDPFSGDELKTAAAVAWLRDKPRDPGRPWVVSLNLHKPHFPHYVTPALWERYAGGDDLPEHGREAASANHPRALDLRRHFQTDQFTDDQIRGLRRGYLGCVDFIDQQLGRLIDVLEATGQLENTVVIYTSDHGDMLGKFGMWWKCSLYEDSVKIPLIVAGPGFGSGGRVKTPVDLHDVRAAIFHAVGAGQPGNWAGTPLQRVGIDDPGRAVFSEYHGHGTRASSYLIRRGQWKLIHHVDAPHQLFDLARDPDELENVYDAQGAVARALEGELRQICDPVREHQQAAEMIRRQIALSGSNAWSE